MCESDTDLDTTPPVLDPSAEKRIAIFRVSHEVLAQALLLPPGTEILGVCPHTYFDLGLIAVKVASPKFPGVIEGQAIPEVNPMLRMEVTATGERRASFVGWDGPVVRLPG